MDSADRKATGIRTVRDIPKSHRQARRPAKPRHGCPRNQNRRTNEPVDEELLDTDVALEDADLDAEPEEVEA